jgi:pyruvate kinase
MRRTRIVGTLGPACEDEVTLRAMIRAGMDVTRINFSYGTHEIHARRIALARRVTTEEGRVIAVMQDLSGSKLRVGELRDGAVTLEPEAIVTLTTEEIPGTAQRFTVRYPWLSQDVRVSQRILLDDGLLELEALGIQGSDVRCRVVVGGVLLPHKGVNLPNTTLSTPTITDKDREDLAFGLAQEVDYVALSFVRAAADIEELKALIADRGASVPVIAKIEKPQALDDLDNIIAASDGVLVARGDLGVEIPAERVPGYQKAIIRRCNEQGKPVITATQMLQSMIENPRPTRAEASDVANAILDGSDAVMLSGETAVGRYPVEAVKTMARIAQAVEREFPHREWLRRTQAETAATITDAIGQATNEIAYELQVRAIITSTRSGFTARMIARHRPAMPIAAVTTDRRTLHRLALVWGVVPLLIPHCANTDEMIARGEQAALEAGLVQPGDVVVFTASVPPGVAGRTNMLKVHVVGKDQRSQPGSVPS